MKSCETKTVGCLGYFRVSKRGVRLWPILLFGLAFITAAQAGTDIIWQGTSGSSSVRRNWDNGNCWAGGNIPDATTENAVFYTNSWSSVSETVDGATNTLGWAQDRTNHSIGQIRFVATPGNANGFGGNGWFLSDNASYTMTVSGDSVTGNPVIQSATGYNLLGFTAFQLGLNGANAIEVDTNTLEIDSVISEANPGSSLAKTGGGKLVLAGANTYTGGTAIMAGTLALNPTGSISNSGGISIAAGGTFDVSAKTSPYNLSASTTLTAAGIGTIMGATAAAIKGPSGGSVGLGAQPIFLTCNGTNPALYISQSTLSLNGNAFTVNTPAPLSPGTYTLIQQATGNIASSGTFTLGGNAIGAGYTGSISVSSASVVLTVGVAGPASVSATQSTVSAAPFSVPADGTTTATITVTLRNGSGSPVSGKTVALASSRGAVDAIAAASGTSDASGVVTFGVASSTTGSSVFTVTDTSDGVTITGTATVTFALPPDQYDRLRLRWASFLLGGTNASDLVSYATAAYAQWTNMNTSPSLATNYLWSDLGQFGASDQQIWTSYSRLQTMATAWAAPGCSLYGNTTLRDNIISGLDWMYNHVYTPTADQSSYGDWYGWDIRAPENLDNVMALMYPALTSTQVTHYCNAIDNFNPDSANAAKYGWMTGANLAGECRTMLLRGILGKNSSRITEATNHFSDILSYVASDDGFYSDGSFIQHHEIAYTGAYGDSCLNDVSSLANLLWGSTWAITDPKLANMYAWVSNSFEPLLYGGAMMDMMRGRTIANASYQADKDEGADCLSYIRQVAQYAQLAGNTSAALSFSNFASAQYPTLPPGQFHFAGMDRVVALRSGFGIGLSMSSSRIANFESINGDNLHGWYTGDGMTYMYLGSFDRQFAGDFWCTVDPYHLPGTTVDQSPRPSAGSNGKADGEDTTTGQNWVGGAHVAGTYGTAGMQLKAYGSTLTAKKSWFMFDQELVCLGAGITCSGAAQIHTTAENRRLGSSPANTLTVNGTVYPPTIGWSSNLTGVSWCALSGVGGYYFPGGANVNAKFEACSGSWSDIGNSSSTNVLTDDYLKLWFNHGVGPVNSNYAYVVLPNLNAASVSNYAANTEILVLQNTTTCQAVSKPSAGLVAASFWADGTNTAGLITVNKKASVITWTNEAGILVGIADPTQTNSGSIMVTLNWPATNPRLMSADTGVTVVQLAPTIILSVNVNGAKGKTFKAFVGFNSPPSAVATNFSTSVGIAVDVDLRTLASDAETPTQSLLFGVSKPANGAVTLLSDSHTARFAPAVNFAGVANFQFTVTDLDGASATNTVWFSVVPTNTAPALAAISNRFLLAGATLVVTNQATDPNLPSQRLGFSLAAAPAGATINASNGLVSWRPTLAQAGTSNQLTVVVTQTGWLTNLAPAADAYVRDGSYANLNYGSDPTLAVKLSGTTGLTRESFLRFDLSGVAGNISDASLRLIPLSTSSPGTHALALATNDAWGETTIAWTNKPGADLPVATWLPQAGEPVLVPAMTLVQSQLATDRLLSLRVYAQNTTSDGQVTYGSRESGANSPTLMLTITNGSLLSATQSFWVTVTTPARPTLSAPMFSSGQFQMLVGGDSGPDYAVEASTNLFTWTPLFTSNAPVLPFVWSDADTNAFPQRFYRIRLGP